MKFEKVDNLEVIHKLYRPGKVQKLLLQFYEGDSLRVIRLKFEGNEYSSIKSAQSSYINAIIRLGLPIKARVLNGELYLIKLEVD